MDQTWQDAFGVPRESSPSIAAHYILGVKTLVQTEAALFQLQLFVCYFWPLAAWSCTVYVSMASTQEHSEVLTRGSFSFFASSIFCL